MRKEYDFSKARRGSVAKAKGKTRITIFPDDDVIAAYKSKSDEVGRGYQTLMNDDLRESIEKNEVSLDTRTSRRNIRED